MNGEQNNFEKTQGRIRVGFQNLVLMLLVGEETSLLDVRTGKHFARKLAGNRTWCFSSFDLIYFFSLISSFTFYRIYLFSQN
jgi:hypothetical protein